MTPTAFILKMSLNRSHKGLHRCFILQCAGFPGLWPETGLIQHTCTMSQFWRTGVHGASPELLRQDTSSSSASPVHPASLVLLGLLMCPSCHSRCLSPTCWCVPHLCLLALGKHQSVGIVLTPDQRQPPLKLRNSNPSTNSGPSQGYIRRSLEPGLET